MNSLRMRYVAATAAGMLFFAVLMGMVYDGSRAGYAPTATVQAPTDEPTVEPTDEPTATPRPTRTPRERPTRTPMVTATATWPGVRFTATPVSGVCDPCAALQTIAAAQATIAGGVP